VDRVILKNERGEGMGFFITVIVSQLVLGVFASMIVAWFSRHREFRADAASASLLGSPQPMVAALARLGGLQPGQLPENMKSFGISPSGNLAAIFSTHPPIEQRIAALQAGAAGQVTH
jgi:heat shock protein HtpX